MAPPADGASAPQPELLRIRFRVGGSLGEHALDVVARLREGDVADRVEAGRPAGAAHPAVDVVRAGVVRRDREHLVAAVAGEQVAQVPGAVRDVDLSRPEVLQLEAGAARLARDELRGAREELHQTLGPGARGAVAELRLLVDDRRDQRRVEALLGGLLANDVLVPERQGELSHGVRPQAHSEHDHGRPREGGEGAGDATPTARGRARRTAPRGATQDRRRCAVGAQARPMFSSRTDSLRSSLTRSPSFSTTYFARSAFSCWGSWREARESSPA